MENKREYPPQRIAAAYICGTMGAALVGTAVNSILQAAQQWPQWTIWFLIIGGILFLTALLLLVPFSWWRLVKNSLGNLPRSLRTTFWLQSVLRFNKDYIYTAVKSHFTKDAWNFNTLTSNPLEPYFEITLEVTNTSIFELKVSGIEGEIIVDGSKCLNTPIVKEQSGIKQGDTFLLSITQSVSDTMLNRLLQAAQNKEKLGFDLHSMDLVFETTTRNFEGFRPRIKFELYNIAVKMR